MIGLSPLVMDTGGAIAFRGPSAPTEGQDNQLKNSLVTTMAWTLALLELAVAVTLALSQALLIAMVIIASLEPSSRQEDQPGM
ncbi:MAG: hypothetical protein OXF67_10370 [Cyanobacteria bacterium MAG CAR4_bin_6]|nr:hypothetical protein [Cyanobacteria bacterium MAG CAR4_bin_6]